jgi:DNA-binding NtrC family response regulator
MVYDSQTKNVIVMEDRQDETDYLDEIIKRLSFNPFFAKSRQEFLENYIHDSSFPYFAMILDNQVPYDRKTAPRKDVGVVMAPQFLKREPGLRVALHTRDNMSSRASEFKKIGLVYLPKPVSLNDLRNFLN